MIRTTTGLAVVIFFAAVLALAQSSSIQTDGSVEAQEFVGDGAQLTAVDAESLDGMDSSDFARASDYSTILNTLSDLQNQVRCNGPRWFYLTADPDYNGRDALGVCEPGFHMASMWELRDPSNLLYAWELGSQIVHRNGDSGWGPPIGDFGWIRTGDIALTTLSTAGFHNCNGYRSSSSTHYGSIMKLDFVIGEVVAQAYQLHLDLAWYRRTCNMDYRVWCVSDSPVYSQCGP